MNNPQTTLSINANGYFERQGKIFIPIGVNYWPSSCGVEMWQAWPSREIQTDLDLVAQLGLNCVRFFLRWQDFEPAPGWYDSSAFSHLSELLTWCRERNLYAHPSLFVGWMSGGIFWPQWKENRNLFSDAWMIERAAGFVRQACEVIAPFHDSLLSVDLGNEMCDLPDCDTAPPGAVIHWCQTITNAVRAVYPQALIVSGNEQRQLNDDSGWRFGDQPGTDYYSMHGYPVPAWHTIGFDGMTDPLAQSLLPSYISAARAFGPVLLQEFGTIATFGTAQQELYLRNLLPACWKAGANGFLWWCLRDIHAKIHPYIKNNFESTLGLVDSNNQVKAGLEYFLEFCDTLNERPIPNLEDIQTGIYLPIHYYHRDDPGNPGQTPRELAPSLLASRYLLQQCGERVRFVTGHKPFPDALKTLVIPGAFLTLDDMLPIFNWVKAGGNLIFNGVDPVNFGETAIQLLGALPVDYRAPQTSIIHWLNEDWEFSGFPRGYRVEVQPLSAKVVALDGQNLPTLLTNRFGKGTVIYSIPFVESEFVKIAHQRPIRERWVRLYGGLLNLLHAGI